MHGLRDRQSVAIRTSHVERDRQVFEEDADRGIRRKISSIILRNTAVEHARSAGTRADHLVENPWIDVAAQCQPQRFGGEGYVRRRPEVD